jgi:hypothetical protein
MTSIHSLITQTHATLLAFDSKLINCWFSSKISDMDARGNEEYRESCFKTFYELEKMQQRQACDERLTFHCRNKLWSQQAKLVDKDIETELKNSGLEHLYKKFLAVNAYTKTALDTNEGVDSSSLHTSPVSCFSRNGHIISLDT